MIVAVRGNLAMCPMEIRRKNKETVKSRPIKPPLSQLEVGGSLRINGCSGEVVTNCFRGKKQPAMVPQLLFAGGESLYCQMRISQVRLEICL